MRVAQALLFRDSWILAIAPESMSCVGGTPCLDNAPVQLNNSWLTMKCGFLNNFESFGSTLAAELKPRDHVYCQWPLLDTMLNHTEPAWQLFCSPRASKSSLTDNKHPIDHPHPYHYTILMTEQSPHMHLLQQSESFNRLTILATMLPRYIPTCSSWYLTNIPINLMHSFPTALFFKSVSHFPNSRTQIT